MRDTPAFDATVRLMELAGMAPEPWPRRLLREHARGEHVGDPHPDCEACRIISEREL